MRILKDEEGNEFEFTQEEYEALTQRENYCVGSNKDIAIELNGKDLHFKNGCKVYSSPLGDGISIEKKYLAGWREYEGKIYICLKGTTQEDLKRFE